MMRQFSLLNPMKNLSIIHLTSNVFNFMKQTYFQLFLGALMFFSTTSLPVFSSILTENRTDLRLSSRSEHLEQLGELPVSDEALQRMYLVRHGESTANVYFEIDGKKVRFVSGQSSNIPLTETGKAQILELTKKLAERFPKETRLIITSSTALRTQQTAKILFKELSKTHSNVLLTEEVYQGLNERHLGEWEGQLKDESYTKAESAWRAMAAVDKFFSPEVEGGESCKEVADRALLALAEIYNRYSGNTIIAVTSFNTINATAIQMNNLPSFLSITPGSNLPKLDLGNGDLVLLETSKNLGFENTHVESHIKSDK
jgi:broad specificity phosphatase PhoE